MSVYRCAACGSPKVMLDTQSGGINFNFAKGALGDAIMGPGGALVGLESTETPVFKCPDCGMTLTYPMANSIKEAIDLGVMDLKSREFLFVDGYQLTWEFLQSQYKNIESGPADHEIQVRNEFRAKSLASVATATIDEFDSAIEQIIDFKSKSGHYYGDRKQYATTEERFSKTNPPQLAEYLGLISAIKTVIENMSQFMPCNLPLKYKALDQNDFIKLFISYTLNEIRYNGYEKYNWENDSYRFHGIFKRDLYNSCYIEFVERNPFVLEFLRRYKEQFPYEAKNNLNFIFNLLDSLSPRKIGCRIDEFFENLIIDVTRYGSLIDYWKETIQVEELYPNPSSGPTSTLNGSADILIPAYKIENGRLGVWDFPVETGIYVNDYMKKCRDFLNAHPEVKKAFDEDIELRKQDLKDAEEYDKTNGIEEKNQNYIKIKEEKMAANDAKIKSLSRKLFGKSKAQNEIDFLKTENEKLLSEKKDLIKAINDAEKLHNSYRGPEFDLYYVNRLLWKHDYLIDWHWLSPKVEPKDESKGNTKNTSGKEATGHQVAASNDDCSTKSGITSTANEIREFKELLDDGIITQEEFDAKKKQLLGI